MLLLKYRKNIILIKINTCSFLVKNIFCIFAENVYIMDEEAKELYNRYFKLFKRFLKDEGCYNFMKRYLFKDRNKNKFLKDAYDLLKEYRSLSFGDILHYILTLGNSYCELGQTHWETHISEIDRKWRKYFEEHRRINKL